MSGRGAKQSPFVGRRVPLVDNGVGILYKRYTHVDELTKGKDEVGSGQTEAKSRKKEKKRKSRAQGDGHDTAGADNTTDSKPDTPAKAHDDSNQEVNNSTIKHQDDEPPPSTSQPAAATDDTPPSAKKRKKKDKKKAAQHGTESHPPSQPEAAQQQAAAPSPPAAVADGAQEQEGCGKEGGGTGAAGAEGTAASTGNAEEAEKIRSVMGFAGLSSKAAPSFSFGFSVEEQKAAETERKLQWIKMADSAKDGVIPRRVYIGGMPYHWEEEHIREYWEYCGEIESLDIMRFPDSGRFRGLAFITFKTQEACDAALACDGEQCEKSTLKVMPSKASAMRKALDSSANGFSHDANNARNRNSGPAGGSGRNEPQKTPGYHVAYVGNISFESTQEELQELFADYSVTKIRMHTDKDTGRFKGYAHLHFADEESLDRAMELDGHKLHSRKIKVSYGQPKKGEQ